MVPMHVRKRKGAFHEPFPLTPSLSPGEGEGVRRTGEGERHRFKVPMRDENVMEAFHEPLWIRGQFHVAYAT